MPFTIDGKSWDAFRRSSLDYNEDFFADDPLSGYNPRARLYDYSYGQIRDAAQQLGIKNIGSSQEERDILELIRNPKTQAPAPVADASAGSSSTPAPVNALGEGFERRTSFDDRLSNILDNNNFRTSGLVDQLKDRNTQYGNIKADFNNSTAETISNLQDQISTRGSRYDTLMQSNQNTLNKIDSDYNNTMDRIGTTYDQRTGNMLSEFDNDYNNLDAKYNSTINTLNSDYNMSNSRLESDYESKVSSLDSSRYMKGVNKVVNNPVNNPVSNPVNNPVSNPVSIRGNGVLDKKLGRTINNGVNLLNKPRGGIVNPVSNPVSIRGNGVLDKKLGRTINNGVNLLNKPRGGIVKRRTINNGVNLLNKPRGGIVKQRNTYEKNNYGTSFGGNTQDKYKTGASAGALEAESYSQAEVDSLYDRVNAERIADPVSKITDPASGFNKQINDLKFDYDNRIAGYDKQIQDLNSTIEGLNKKVSSYQDSYNANLNSYNPTTLVGSSARATLFNTPESTATQLGIKNKGTGQFNRNVRNNLKITGVQL